MKAIGVAEFGRPTVLDIADLPDCPPPPRGWARIRVRAAGVNPGDIAFRRNACALMMSGSGLPPYVPGMDAAGTIEEIGFGSRTDLQVGDAVMALVHPVVTVGAYAETILVPLRSIARIPAGSTYAEAATLPLCGLTARLALDLLGLTPGDTVAVTGAAGGVGGFVVQLAKADGLRVVADAAEADADLVAKLGADIVVRRGPGFAERVREVMPSGVDGAVDAASLGEVLLPAVRDDGAIATLRGLRDRSERGIAYHPVFVAQYARDPDRLDRLAQQVESGQLTLRVAAVLPAEEASCAHRVVEAGGVRGRIVLEF